MYKFLVEKYIFTIFAYELFKVKKKNCNKYQKYIYLGQNTTIYCSQIIVVDVHANGFCKVHPTCHNIANGIKPGNNSKKTNKHAANCSKAYVRA